MEKSSRIPLLAAAGYACINFIWVYFSSLRISSFATDSLLARMALLEGLCYVLITTLLFYWGAWFLMRKFFSAQRKLIKEKKDLEATLGAFPDFIVVLSVEGNIIDCKPGAGNNLFENPEFLPGKNLRNVFPPGIAGSILEALGRVCRNRAPATVEFVSTDPKSGTRRFYEARILPETMLQYIAVIRDMSKLKQAEEEQRNAIAGLDEEKAKSESIIAGIGDGITIQDTDFNIIYQNQILKDLMGSHVSELCYKAYEKNDRICDGCLMKQTLNDGQIRRSERCVTINGSKRYLDNTVSPIRNAEGEIVAGIELFRDVTERRRAEEKLRKTQEFLANLMELVPMPIYVTKKNGSFQMVNRAWEEFTGVSRDIAIGKHLQDFFRDDVARQFMLADRQFIDDDSPRIAEQFLDSKKGRQYFHIVKFPLHDAAGQIEAAGGILVDITERKRFEEELLYQANHDYLTGLPNRSMLNERLEEALRFEYNNKGQLALLLLDLDNFKVINDTFGHPAGDLFLKDVSEKLKHNLRQYDTISRLGGDEFVILIRDTEKNLDIGRIASRILSIFDNPVLIKGQEVFVTASLGIAIYPTDGDNAEILLKNADAAMFHAKKKWKNNYQFFTEEINADVHARLALETKLRRALEREEFFLNYQPRIVSGGRISGMEALLRWQPEGGKPVSPVEFIPVLEETGLIVQVEEWVLRTSCRQTKQWQEEGLPPLRLAVNISARHFSQENLPDKIAQILYETGLESRFLEIELTESIIMKDVEESIKKLDRLKEMGITFSIDDFGTGYSSLSYLKRFPIDVLKIDRSFVDGIPNDPSDTTIATTVIAMAHNLNMLVVAEGVETPEQLQFLEENHCDEYQGYLFSKPLHPQDFTCFIMKESFPVLKKAMRR